MPVGLREEERPVFLPSYRGEVGVTKAASRFNERLQNRLEIKSRAADDLEHVGGGGLLFQGDGKLGSTFSNHLFKLLGRLFALGQQPIKRDRIVAKYFDSAPHLGDLDMAGNGNREVVPSAKKAANSSKKRGKPRNNIPPDIEPDKKDRTGEAEQDNRQQRDAAELLNGFCLICGRRDTA